jgi:hypothetical protein
VVRVNWKARYPTLPFVISQMAGFFQSAHNTDASHSQFNSVGRDQYNIRNTNITYSANHDPILASLKPIDRSGYYVPPCMRGTRRWVVDKINSWLDDPLAPNILWLSGSPGAGKSTIASTVVSQLAERGRLGSNIFFKRGDVALSDPATVWRTVAFDLAQIDKVFAQKLMDHLKKRKVDPARADIESHFKHLIEEPLTESWKAHQNVALTWFSWLRNPSKATMQSPVIVFDALDECGSDGPQSTQRQIFMDTIMKWSRLHRPLKLLITSRDRGITPSFRDVCHCIPLDTGDLVSRESNADIQTFFEQSFAEIATKYPSLRSWPGPSVVKQLTDRAAGLFIWADTIIRYMHQGFPKAQLDLILNGAFREEGDAIDQLYQQILQFSFKHPRVLDTFRRVVGAIVLSKTPLHRGDLCHFLGQQEDESSIDFILDNLSSVMSYRNNDGRIHISVVHRIHLRPEKLPCRIRHRLLCSQSHHGIVMPSCHERGPAIQYLPIRNVVFSQRRNRSGASHKEMHTQSSLICM